MIYTIYDATTGLILSSYEGTQPPLEPHVSGSWSPQDYMIKNQRPVAIPPRPPALGYRTYEFDPVAMIWRLNTGLTQAAARRLRDQYLLAVDRVNPIWYADLTPARQAELAAYRSALLAVPQQPGFPEVIEWPAKPTWL